MGVGGRREVEEGRRCRRGGPRRRGGVRARCGVGGGRLRAMGVGGRCEVEEEEEGPGGRLYRWRTFSPGINHQPGLKVL